MKVYLAGPIAGLNYGGATDWRDEVARRLAVMGSFVSVSPMRGKEYLKGSGVLLPSGYSDTLLSGDRQIVTRDRMDVRTCDVMLVNFLGAPKISAGTMVEFGWADSYGKPIITVMEADNPHQHAFVKELSGYIVDNLEDAYTILAALNPLARPLKATRVSDDFELMTAVYP